MSFTQSLAMAVPVARQEICNRLMEACYRGPNTFSVPLRDKVTLARVAYGAHTYDDELIGFFVNNVTPPGITLARLQAYNFATVTAARTAAGYIRHREITGNDAMANMKACLDAQGWEIEPSPGP